MIAPVIPLFITFLGGNSVIVGTAGGLTASIGSLLKAPFGYVSDRKKKRKLFVGIGYATSALFKLFMAFSTLWSHVLAAITFERVGKGVRTSPRDAIISESSKEKGKGFGLHRAMDTAGAVVGSIIVFFMLYSMSMKYNTIILAAAILALIALIPLMAVKETASKKYISKPAEGLSDEFKRFLVVAAVFSLGNVSYMFFILKVSDTLSGNSAAMAVVMYVFFNITYAILSYPMGIASDKAGRAKILVIGYLIFILAFLGMVVSSDAQHFLPVFVLYGVGYAAVDGNQRALVSDLSKRSHRAYALGLYHTTIGLVSIPANVVFGILYMYAPGMPFVIGALLIAMAGTFLTAWFWGVSPKE